MSRIPKNLTIYNNSVSSWTQRNVWPKQLCLFCFFSDLKIFHFYLDFTNIFPFSCTWQNILFLYAFSFIATHLLYAYPISKMTCMFLNDFILEYIIQFPVYVYLTYLYQSKQSESAILEVYQVSVGLLHSSVYIFTGTYIHTSTGQVEKCAIPDSYFRVSMAHLVMHSVTIWSTSKNWPRSCI